ncbi:hypothetical protein ACIBSW_31330 [Actinoplanes sp. NPDC049668]|uniref:hypothetical protein n=1 Tax=unclassified Actinoplanes TaxID=2626549 RepID=UPI0033A5DE4C
MADSQQGWSAFGSPATPSSADEHGTPADPPAPKYGPAPPAGPGRASFGFTAGPISGNHNARTAPATGAQFPPAVPPPAPRKPEPRMPEPRLPEPRLPESRSPESRSPEPRSPEPHPVRSVTGESVLARSRQARTPYAVGEDEGIGDFIGGPGREIRPHRAARHPHATGEQAILTGPTGGGGRGVFFAGVALSAAVLFGGVIAGVSYFSGPDKSLTSVLELGAGNSGDRTVTAPVDGRTVASFELATAATKLTMRSEDLGEDLYRISTAEDAGILPQAVVDKDRVQLKLVPGGDGGSGAVEVVLSTKVMWNLRLSGAVDEQRIDFAGGAIGAIDLIGGSRVTEIALPEPAGTVALKITGVIDELALTSPQGNPVRVKMQGGAKTVAAGARTLRNVEPGSTLTPKGWATNDRYDVTAETRVTLLSVETVE